MHDLKNKLQVLIANETFRVFIIILSLIIPSAGILYFNNITTPCTMISLLFFVPIVLGAVWWKEKGLIVAISVSVFVIATDIFLSSGVKVINNIVSCCLFIMISIIVIKQTNVIVSLKKKAGLLENKYKQLFDHMQSAISYNKIEKNSDGIAIDYIILDVNVYYEKLFSVEKAKIINNKANQINHKFISPCNKCISTFAEVAETGLGVKFDFYHESLDKWLNFEVFSPEKDYFILILRDVTSKKNAEIEKEKIQNQVQYSEKLASIGILAAGAAHEINNPLTIIQLNADDISDYLKEKNIFDAFLSTKIKNQLDSIQRISKIIRSLKTYISQNDESMKALNINQLLENSLFIIEAIYKKENILIETNFDNSNPLTIGSSSKLQQVFMNLLANAKEAIDSNKGGIINIKTEVLGNKIVINITDNGIGIPEQHLNKIFEYFYTTKRPGYGTGLGLSIAHSIITDMNGELKVTSKVNEGTEFTILLPLVSEDSANSRLLCEATDLHNKTKRVLIVDDEEDILKIVKRYLVKQGFEVDMAISTEYAIELMQSKNYFLLITDLKMPGISGIQMIKIAKELGLLKNTIILVITGGIITEHPKNDQVYLKNEVNGILYKPFNIPELRDTLNSFGI